MSVVPAVSLDHIVRELEEAEALIVARDLELDTSMLVEEDLRFRVSGKASKDGELYIVEFRCDDYRELPPFIEMIDPDSGEPGTKHAYPNVFHNRPCICARFNRKTYPGYTGLHRDWKFGDWAEDGITDHLGGMISHIFASIDGRNGRQYIGRQA